MNVNPGVVYYDLETKRLNTWQVGGIAKRAYAPLHPQDAAEFILSDNTPTLWLGLGSNVLLPEVIHAKLLLTKSGLKHLEKVGDLWIAQAGVSLAKLGKATEKANEEGGQYFAGIPGTVGGALHMNAGAWGHEFWEYVQRVQVIDPQKGLTWLDKSAFTIGYRHVQGPAHLGYTACELRFSPGQTVPLKNLLEKRNATQPIGTHNCGSVFRNPYPHSAGKLIEECGLKGFSIGDAQVSTKHANFIINTNNATYADITALIRHIQKTVLLCKGIALTPEVKIYANVEGQTRETLSF